jgi:hypothetical protein
VKHKDNIKGYEGSIEDLAKETKNINYNTLEYFLATLSEGIRNDSEADERRERYQLSKRLYSASNNIKQAKFSIKGAKVLSLSHDSSKYKEKLETFDIHIEDLALQIKDLKYDSLAEYLRLLSREIKNEANSHRKEKRYNLAASLYDTAYYIKQAKKQIDIAWNICEPYMRKK